MSLSGSLQVGRSGIAASQAALQVIGNNMANAATEGYNRRSVHLSPTTGEQLGRGIFAGRGVQFDAIRREVDTALQGRLRDAISQEHAAGIEQRFLSSLEALQNELSDNDLTSIMGEFFSSFSELANTPDDIGFRAVVIEQGRSLAGRLSGLRSDYEVLREESQASLNSAVSEANDLLDQIAEVNANIAQTEAGIGEANALRDQRDALIDELAQYLDVSAIQQPNGGVDLLVGSTPVILAGQSRGLELRTEAIDGVVELSLRVAADGTTLQPTSGQIGSLLDQRENAVDDAIATLDSLASQLIFQVNRLHSQGQGTAGFATVTGTYDNNDPTANLNSLDANLPFRIEDGSFLIHVTSSTTGLRQTHHINVDGDANSLNDLIDEINVNVAVPNVTASLSSSNRLTLSAATGYEISFSDDSSGALAALGINTYFQGKDAADIDVNQTLRDEPWRLAAGSGHVPGSNGTALSLAGLGEAPVDELGGASLSEYWQNEIISLAARSSAANLKVESTNLIRASVYAQVQGVSGVSLDDEAVNLLTYQRQFQAAARFIATIDETLQTLLSIA